MNRRGAVVAFTLGIFGTLLGCGDGGTTSRTAEAPGSTTSTTAERLVTCGYQPFPPSLLDQAPLPLDAPGPALEATREYLAGDGQGWFSFVEGDLEPTGFRVLSEDGSSAQVGIELLGLDGEPLESFAVLYLERDGDDWRFAGSSGGCELRTFVDGDEAGWYLDPASPPPGAESTEIPILVTERTCNGGDPDISDRIAPPLIEVVPEAVTVTISVRPVGGASTCQGGPPTPYLVDLGEPLGDRQLLEGSTYPPTPAVPYSDT